MYSINKIIYFYILFSFVNCFSVLDFNLINQQDNLVKEELLRMHKNGNTGATFLHAAVEVNAMEWIKGWKELNINKNNFKEIIKKRDNLMLTAKQLANYRLRVDIASYLEDCEKVT